jgi:autotransporter-associated beta strand protein
MLTNGQISQSTGITVNAGGQLQLADNANTENLTWNLASGAVLNLNGTGKALLGPNEVASPDGALRIAVLATHPQTEFQNNVVLQTDSTINVATAGTTGTLSGTVTGAGGLTKSGAGSLALSNGANGYQGDTVINGGTLSIASSFLSNTSDVFLTTGSVFNLNFGGSDTIRALFVDGTPQPLGTYGAADLGGLLITGGGTLTVTEVPVIGLDGDHNADGVVDAADYVAWRKDPGGFGGDPGGYEDWVGNFGESQLGSGNGAPVPEPAVGVSILLATALCVMSRRQR